MHVRHLRIALLSVACSALTSACASSGRTEVVSTGDVARSVSGARLTATLSPENRTTVMGTAVVEPTIDPDRTQIRIAIHGAPPNINLPWHIHHGTCSTDLGIYGAGASYPMLGTSSDGRAELQTVLPVEPPDVGTHVVRVFAGPGSDVVVACGSLAPASSES